MNNNRNTKSNKHRNRRFKKTQDSSNNNVFLSLDDSFIKNDNNNQLHHSNEKKSLKLNNNHDDSNYNIIFKKNNLKLKDGSNIMTKSNSDNKLIHYIDKKYNQPKIDQDKTDILLKFLLKQSEADFFNAYNTPFFSGIPNDLPQLENNNDQLLDQLEETIIREKILIDASIDNLIDLISLCDKYPLLDTVEYNVNMTALHKIKPTLLELQNMIGMKSIKENIVDQIIYFIQDLHNISPNNSDYMHAVISGPPGTGKTEVAKIMGKIFSNLGILKNNVFKKVTRDDLVAGYLGQTAMKTKEVIKECIGGVLFIDEAYALGNKEKKDSFSKESIDTINEALSDHKKDLMCIIAGYDQELKDCFFSYNPGMESRFTWKFKIDEYSPSELRLIFEKQIRDSGWNIKEPFSDEWFNKNKDCFSYFGRDMETLFSKVKIAHSRRVFCLPKDEKTFITHKDLEKGFTIFKEMGDSQQKMKEIEDKKRLYHTLYC
jgi:AAA+ superfamily predicted ATPase